MPYLLQPPTHCQRGAPIDTLPDHSIVQPGVRMNRESAAIAIIVVLVVFSDGMGGCNRNGDNNGSNVQSLVFKDTTADAGFNYKHGYLGAVDILSSQIRENVGGAAAGDYDGDGWVDLYVVRGDIGPNLLFHNRGDGTFEEVGEAARVAVTGAIGSGPIFADYDGDGRLDLLIGGVDGTKPRLFHNRGDGTFEDVTVLSGLSNMDDSVSAAFGDYNLDGRLDIYISHWLSNQQGGHLWRNNGDGTFTDVSSSAGIPDSLSNDFTANFADINNDGRPDLLIAADFGTSQIYLNNGNGTFTNVTTSVISDENGMGAAVGDYDNDGDLDWFVTSIYDPNGVTKENWGITGNRLYRNRGDGTFEDATDGAGVRVGYWGWGSCFADFNNDGYLDIFHVNGFDLPGLLQATLEFMDDPSRLFLSNGDGTFTERSLDLGLDDRGQGRGVVCFDYDHDGDIDIFIANNQQAPRLFRNDGGNHLNFLNVKLQGDPPNTEAIGARIFLTAGTQTQMRELRAGSNYVSQDPVEAHFGLGKTTMVDEVRIVWPSGATTILQNIPVNQFMVVPQSQPLSRVPITIKRAARS